jgi:hypothetical protein
MDRELELNPPAPIGFGSAPNSFHEKAGECQGCFSSSFFFFLVLFQNDFSCFIQNTVARPAISQIHTDRQLLVLENFVTKYLHSERLRATPEQLCDALGACTDLKPVYRRLLKMALEQLQLLEQQIGQLDQELATLLHPHQDAVQRLAEVPGLGVDSAQQIIAEVGPTAATFPSGEQLSSWVGACPGDEESAGVNYSHRSPKGNRHMRRLLNQAANAAVKVKGSIFEIIYRRCIPRLGHNQAIGLIAHRQCRLIWLILHKGTLYEERGPAVTKRSKYQRTWRMIRQLQQLGYRIESPNPQASQAQA